MLSKLNDKTIPINVRLASRLILIYAIWVMIGALWFAFTTNFADMKWFLRGVLRFAGMTYLGLWLLTLNKQAWRFCVGACLFFLTMSALGISAMLYVAIAHNQQESLWVLLKFIFPIYLLGHAAVLLLKKETRSQFS